MIQFLVILTFIILILFTKQMLLGQFKGGLYNIALVLIHTVKDFETNSSF